MKRETPIMILMYVVLAVVAAMQVGCIGPVNRTANAAFMKAIGDTSMTVFPAYVRRGRECSYDADAAKRISAFLRDEGLASATDSDKKVPISGPWHMNQARMLRESAADFAAYLTEHPVDTEYALLPEYLGGRRAFGGVHGYIVDADHRIAYVFLQNSHWTIFKDVNPQTVDDCTEILIRFLRENLTPDRNR